MASRLRRALAAFACLALLAGCASLGLGVARSLPDAGRECPGTLVPAAQLAGDFVSRSSVRVQGEDLDWRLTLVAQKRADTLVLIGLDTFGGKLFVLKQRGSEVAVERPRGALPLPPVDLLRDWQRARLSPPAGGFEDGVTLLRADDGAVTIEHPGCGYRATLVLLEETPLPSPAPTDP